MKIRQTVLCVLAVMCLFSVLAVAQEKPLTLEEQAIQKSLFQTLDTELNLPDLSKASIVRVINRAWQPWENGIRLGLAASKVEYGFLLKEDEESFTVYFTTTLQLTLRRTKSPNSARYEKMNDKEFLKQWFKPYRKEDFGFESSRTVFFGDQKWVRPTQEGGNSDYLDTLFFARFYAARGDWETANRFFRYYMVNNEFPKLGRKALLGQGYSMSRFHLPYLLNDPFCSREAALEQMQLTAKRYPEEDARFKEDSVGEWQNLLAKMIEEDRKHAAKTLPPLDKMPLRERVAELIFRLRDALYFQRRENATGNFFGYPYDESFKTKALFNSDKALVRIGFPAIPQLIEAFDDRRFTRGGYRIGEAAREIFTEITSYNFADIVNDRKASNYKKAALIWWAGFQKKGERQVLIAMTSKGDGASIKSAERLVKAYPKDALSAVIKGFQNATDPYDHNRLMEIITTFKENEAYALARSVMWKDKHLGARLTAAKMCWSQGDLQALKAMLWAWKHPQEWNSRSSFDKEHLIEFLVRTRHPDVVSAFLSTSDTEFAQHLYTILGDLFDSPSDSESGQLHENVLAEQVRVRAKYEKRVESFLIQVLPLVEQISVYPSVYWKQRKQEMKPSDGRACDIAGALLAFIRPDKYRFSLGVPLRQREVQRLMLMNQLRKEKGLALLPVPPLPTQKYQHNVVSQILFANNTPALPAKIKNEILAMQGRKLDTKVFVQNLTNILENLPPNTQGIYVEMDSAGDGTGIRLFFQFLPGKKGVPPHISFFGDVNIHSPVENIGGVSYSQYHIEIPEDVVQRLNRVLALPEKAPFEAFLRFGIDNQR